MPITDETLLIAGTPVSDGVTENVASGELEARPGAIAASGQHVESRFAPGQNMLALTMKWAAILAT